ncbi:MAG: MaoC family dehydratase [Oligoflexus sp.]
MKQAESPFTTTVAHGFLVLSLCSYFLSSALKNENPRMGVNYGLNRVRFAAPVPSGSRLRGHFKLVASEEIAPLEGFAGEQQTWAVTIEREGASKPACVAEWITRCYG